MAPVKKTALWTGALVFSSILGLWVYLATTTMANFEFLLLCSQGKDELVPKSLCQTYLLNFRGTPEEIATINQGAGIRWGTDAKTIDDREKLVKFLLKKGVDINAIDRRSGLSALHAAVLENNIAVVNILLRNGANPAVKDRTYGKTPLEFALELQNRPNQPDRAAVIKLLNSAGAMKAISKSSSRDALRQPRQQRNILAPEAYKA